MGVRTGVPVKSEKLLLTQYADVLFGEYENNLESAVVTVIDVPLVVYGFDIPSGTIVEVHSVGGAHGELETPFMYLGTPLLLHATANPIVLGVSGRYRLKVNGERTGLVVTTRAWPTAPKRKLGNIEQPYGAQVQRPNVLFGDASTSEWSTVIDVIDVPLVITAFGATTETVEVYVVHGADGGGATQYVKDGVPLVLDADNNPIVLPSTGRYRLRLDSGVGSVRVTQHPSAIAYGDPYGSGGTPGPPGPPGPPTPPLVLVAAETIHGRRAVRAVSGQAYHPDTAVDDDAPEVVGISLNSASLGGDVQVRTSGQVTEGSWTWAPGYVYCGDDGVLTQTPDSTGWLLAVGRAVNATTIDVDVDTAFFRG